MVLEGSLAGFGEISFTYGVSNDTLFCMVGGSPSGCSPRCETPYWQDCVYLSHSLPGEAELLRHGSGHFEETALAEFFSPAQVLVRGASLSLRLGHGGNLFFKRAGNELWNLLWAYNEISDSFWWSVSVGPG